VQMVIDIPSPKPISAPPVPDELLERFPELAAGAKAWRRLGQEWRAAQATWLGVLPPNMLAGTGAALLAADARVRSAIAAGERDGGALAEELTGLKDSDSRRWADMMVALALLDNGGDELEALYRAAQPRALAEADAVVGWGLGQLAPLSAPVRDDDADAAVVIATVKGRMAKDWAPLRQLAWRCENPRSPKGPPNYTLPDVIAARLRELDGKPPKPDQPWVDTAVGSGLSEYGSGAAAMLGIPQPPRLVAERPGRGSWRDRV
jgi:hypothetical protein